MTKGILLGIIYMTMKIKVFFATSIYILLSTVFFSLLASSEAYAQDIDQAIKEVDRPVREEVEEKLKVLPKKKLEIKEKKEEGKKELKGPAFFIKNINLVGIESFPSDHFKLILEKYENRKIKFEELNILAKKIEREYLNRGIIAACFLPPQDIKEDTATLQIVESKMGNLEVRKHKYFNEKRLPRYWQIKPGEILRYDKISRSLQRMNKNPDREAKATLYAGEKPGTTDVLLDVDTNFPIHSTFSFDKEGSTYTGKDRIGFGGRHNNFLGLDDTLLGGYVFGSDFYGIYGYHKIPLTKSGTSLLYGYSHTTARPKKDFEHLKIKSQTNNMSFSIRQGFFKKDNYIGDAHFGIDFKDKLVKQGSVTSNEDALRILRLGTSLIHRFPGHVTYIKPEFSQGINYFGAKRRTSLSSRGAKSTFSKYNLRIRHKMALPLNLKMSLNFKGQLAPEKLTPQEQFFLGGINSVRGYPSANYLADEAVQLNSEILIPAFFIPKKLKLPFDTKPLKDVTTGLLFFDYAYGRRRDSSEAEKPGTSLASVGAGVRIRLFNQALVRLEWGFPITSYTSITGSTDGRLHLSVTFEDKIFK